MGTNVTNPVKYNSRTFEEMRTDLISLVRQYYPDVLSDFQDASIGAALLDMNAGIGDNLSYNTDRAFQETQLEYVQQRANLLNIAKNMGFNIPGRRPSVTVVDFTTTIPVNGDRPDESYYPILSPGAQVIGGGKVFETTDTIDWNSPVSSLGDRNRTILPNLDSNGIIQSYSVKKREVVINGATSIYKRVITDKDIKPFFEISLPDPDVLEIESIILLEGTNYSVNPPLSDFYNTEYRYNEVNYLAQQRIFVENVNAAINSGSQQNNDGIKVGRWIDIKKKFIREFTSNGFIKITFGSGDPESTPFEDGLLKVGVNNKQFIQTFLQNTSLGLQLRPNHTLFVRYKTGGGVNSNLGEKAINSLGTYQMRVVGPRQDFNQQVERSLTVNNPIPAFGGNDGLSLEQIRNLTSYNFSGQNRDVTLTDYLVDVYKMPGKFGSPYRANAYKENNKIVIPILGIDSNAKLTNSSNSLLKSNITEYLSQGRMINDYIEIKDGKILNLAIEIDLHVKNISDTQISNNVITVVKDFFDINNYEMNTDIFITDLTTKIREISSVVNVLNIKVYNKVGGQYSNNAVSQEIIDTSTGEIYLVNNTIYSTTDSMFEIKYPEKDIKVLLRKEIVNV
jgi:hypothetical protein